MKNIFFYLVILFSVASCSNIKNDTRTLYSSYLEYETNTDRSNIINQANDLFSPRLLGDEYRSNTDALNQLLFKDYMLSKNNHFERITGKSGCLTINGYDEENSPLVFNLKYISMNNDWLIDQIHVVFVESTADFTDRVECPDKQPE